MHTIFLLVRLRELGVLKSHFYLCLAFIDAINATLVGTLSVLESAESLFNRYDKLFVVEILCFHEVCISYFLMK